MPLNQRTTRTFTRTLYAGILQTVTLLKRNDDQQEGTIRSIQLFDCRQSRVFKTGEPIQGDMSVDHITMWHIPRRELDRVGVSYINAADRLIDKQNRYWQPESNTVIEVKLFENEVDLQCKRTDPPKT